MNKTRRAPLPPPPSPLLPADITIGPLVVDAIRPLTDAVLDTHLMIVEPEQRIADFAKAWRPWGGVVLGRGALGWGVLGWGVLDARPAGVPVPCTLPPNTAPPLPVP